MIDLRSDTVTKPTQKMLDAMMHANVGDDVFREDEHANQFQEKVARLFGMEAGLFVPSGTMSNQLGIKVLTEPGDEILIDEKGHIYNYETGGASFLSGVQIHTLQGKRGKISVHDLKNRKRGTYDWEPNTKVIALENTTNKGGGVSYSKDELKALKEFADEENLFVHLDGARIWNAMMSTGIEATFFGEIADTISVCFSKGLGAPVGSMLLSTKKRIDKARRFRKMWGGGMRQIGLLTTAAEFALENHFKFLAEDHRRAMEFAEAINSSSQLSIDLDSVETNIVMFDVNEGGADRALNLFSNHNIHLVPFGPNTIRATFHFQITDEDLNSVIEIIQTKFS